MCSSDAPAVFCVREQNPVYLVKYEDSRFSVGETVVWEIDWEEYPMKVR